MESIYSIHRKAVDYTVIEKYGQYLNTKGVKAIYVNGTTGEGTYNVWIHFKWNIRSILLKTFNLFSIFCRNYPNRWRAQTFGWRMVKGCTQIWNAHDSFHRWHRYLWRIWFGRTCRKDQRRRNCSLAGSLLQASNWRGSSWIFQRYLQICSNSSILLLSYSRTHQLVS